MDEECTLLPVLDLPVGIVKNVGCCEAYYGPVTHILAAKSARDKQLLTKMGAFLRAATSCFTNQNRCQNMLQNNR